MVAPAAPTSTSRLPTAGCPRPGSSITTTTSWAPGGATCPAKARCGTSSGLSTRSNRCEPALGLDRGNFVLLGHSWGGILAAEYALAHGEHLKGLVISNMMMDVPAYNAYARDVLMPAMDQVALAEIEALEAAGDYENPRFMELLMEHHYVHHVLRMPAAEWPDPARRGIDHINPAIYVKMQGPSELGISASATLAKWSRFNDLHRIGVPALVIGATHDTMDPAHMAEVARRLPQGTYLHCPDGSHMAMYDDQEAYFRGLISWLDRLR